MIGGNIPVAEVNVEFGVKTDEAEIDVEFGNRTEDAAFDEDGATDTGAVFVVELPAPEVRFIEPTFAAEIEDEIVKDTFLRVVGMSALDNGEEKSPVCVTVVAFPTEDLCTGDDCNEDCSSNEEAKSADDDDCDAVDTNSMLDLFPGTDG